MIPIYLNKNKYIMINDYITDNIELSATESSDGLTVDISFNDAHGHYEKSIKLSNDQAFDLLNGLNSIKDYLKKNEFD